MQHFSVGSSADLKEQCHGFSMILTSSKTYLNLRKRKRNGFTLETTTRQKEVRMASDGLDGSRCKMDS